MSAVDVRVLGPVEVWRGYKPIELARRQQRLIVGILALEPNRVVSGEHLVDALWAGHPPPHGRAVMRSRISELRAVLAPPAARDGTARQDGAARQDDGARLLTSGNGYLLRIAPERVDAYRFRGMVAAWRDARTDHEARDMLRAALGLWRGPALGGWLEGEASAILCQNLESERLTAVEDLFDIELRLGSHLQVVDQITTLFAENPTRERLGAAMMIALHRSGRTAEALRDYDRWRRWLRDELGVDPGVRLQRVHQAILRGDDEPPVEDNPGRTRAAVAGSLASSSPDRPETSSRGPRTGTTVAAEPAESAQPIAGQRDSRPQMLPPDIVDLMGRPDEIGAMEACLSPPGPRVVVVTGRGGVGKTALSVHVAHRGQDQFVDGTLFANLHGVGEEQPTDPFELLGRFLRALGVDGSELPRSLDGRVDLYRNVLSHRRVLVVLDNAASDDQVLPLVPGGSTSAVVVNSRARLGVTFGARVVSLDVLDAAPATSLLASIVGEDRVTAEPEATAELARQCAYLPLALRVVGAKLATKRHWRVQKLVGLLRDQRNPLDHLTHGHLDVRASIALSYSDLAPQAKRLLRLVGHIGLQEITVRVSAALLGSDVAAAEDLLEMLFDVQLVTVIGRDGSGHPRFRLHDLVWPFARERANAEESEPELSAARARLYGAQL